MTIESAFYSYLTSKPAITALVSTRIYPLLAPDTPTYPFITYTVFGEGHDHDFSGATGLVDLTMQCDVWAKTVIDRSDITEALRNALDGFTGDMGAENLNVRQCYLIDRAHFFERDTEESTPYYRTSMDFSIWHVESLPTL
jgi:hypothetical protein